MCYAVIVCCFVIWLDNHIQLHLYLNPHTHIPMHSKFPPTFTSQYTPSKTAIKHTTHLHTSTFYLSSSQPQHTRDTPPLPIPPRPLLNLHPKRHGSGTNSLKHFTTKTELLAPAQRCVHHLHSLVQVAMVMSKKATNIVFIVAHTFQIASIIDWWTQLFYTTSLK